MDYVAEHLDPQKIEEGLKGFRDFQMQQKEIAIEKATSFFEGYNKALYAVAGMLHCCNYESKEKKTKAFFDGADHALYEICKELDIGSQDIRSMDVSIDEKAALLAARIKEIIGNGKVQS